MPTGNRYRGKIYDRKIDISAAQYRLLSLLTHTNKQISTDWILAKGYDRQALGLKVQGLWRLSKGYYLLTKRGEEFLHLVRARTQPQTRKVTNGKGV